MHALLHILAATTSTTAKPKSSSSNPTFLIFIIVIFVGAYFLFIRPRQQRMRQQQTATRQLSVGDPVITAGGIHGTVVALDDNVAEVEVAPGVVMTFLRRAVTPRPGSAPAEPAGPDEDNWQVPGGELESAGGTATGGSDGQFGTERIEGTEGTGSGEDPPGSQTEHQG